MTMYELTSVLWARRLLVAAAAAVVFVLGALLVLVGISTTYTARAQVLMDQPALVTNISGNNVPAKLSTMLPTLCRLVDGDEAVAAIAAAAQVPASTVHHSLRCLPVAGTTIVTLQAKTSSAARSQRIASAGATVFTSTVTHRYSGGDVPPREAMQATVLQAAGRPGRDPNHARRQLALVAVGALIVAAALALAAEPYRREDAARRAPASGGAPLD
jgi:capsular polysaccharide biosynthesis protein